jgi:type I restriction enzyme M protein
MIDENSGEDGLLIEVIEGEGDKQKIIAKSVKARLKEIGKDVDYVDELKVLQNYVVLLDKQAKLKSDLKIAQEDLTEKLSTKYLQLTEKEVKNLAIDDKWITALNASVQKELHRVSQTLTGRISQLSERYGVSLPILIKQLSNISSKVDKHLKKMGKEWIDA